MRPSRGVGTDRRYSPSNGTEEEKSKRAYLRKLVDTSGSPMLLVDDSRRYVRCNWAACDLLELPEEEVYRMKIEDLSAPALRDRAASMFDAFLESGSQSGPYTLVTPKGVEVDCFYCATANVVPGLHLSVLVSEEQFDPALDAWIDRDEVKSELLTPRERQVLSLLALGENNGSIAAKLGRSPETVRKQTLSARERLGARSRSHAIALAIQAGELDLSQGVESRRSR